MAADTLLAALEDPRDALIESGHLAVVAVIESEVRVLNRKLGLGEPDGGIARIPADAVEEYTARVS